MKNNDQKSQTPQKPSELPYYFLILFLCGLTIVLSPLPRLADNWVQNHNLTRHTNAGHQESGIEKVVESRDEKIQEVVKLDQENSRLEKIYEEQLSIYDRLLVIPDNETYREEKEDLLERNRILTEEALSYEKN